jgi:transketolase
LGLTTGSVNEGTEKVHGSPLDKDDIQKIKEKFDFNPNQDFVIPQEVDLFWKDIKANNSRAFTNWTRLFEEYSKHHPDLV